MLRTLLMRSRQIATLCATSSCCLSADVMSIPTSSASLVNQETSDRCACNLFAAGPSQRIAVNPDPNATAPRRNELTDLLPLVIGGRLERPRHRGGMSASISRTADVHPTDRLRGGLIVLLLVVVGRRNDSDSLGLRLLLLLKLV